MDPKPARGERPPAPASSSTVDPGENDAGMGAEATYQRILRKLQRQANYELRSVASSRSILGLANSATAATVVAVSGDSGGGVDDDGGGDGGGSRTRERGEVQGGTEPRAAADADERETEDERRFGELPVPATLRILVDDVRATVAEKLELAAMSSVKDCMRYIFDSRGLLDKLLKDLPRHGNYVESRSVVATKELQEWFQEFRKVPVLLPVSSYQVQQESGSVLPELSHRAAPPPLGTDMEASRVGRLQSSAGAQLRRSIVSPVAPRRPSIQSSSGSAPARSHGRPPNSARLQTSPAASVLSGTFSQQPSASAFTCVTSPSLLHSRDHAMLMKHLRRQTQTLEIGTQSDESVSKMVPKEELEAAMRRVAQIELVVMDYEEAVERLKAQLDAAKGTLAHRAHSIQYLRETLYKECCVLRQQLAAAHQGHARASISHASRPSLALSMAGSGGGASARFDDAASGENSQRSPRAGDATAVHSLLDLALLALEKDKQIDENGELVISTRDEIQQLRDQLRDRQIRHRREQTALRHKFTLLMGEKNKQLQAMRISTDTVRMRGVLASAIAQLQSDFTRMRQQVQEKIAVMHTCLFSMAREVDFTVKTASTELIELRQGQVQHGVVADTLKASESLFLPMLRPEFALGCHTWEHTRQSEPLRAYVAHNFGHEVLHKVAPELHSLQLIYTNLQRFVLQMFQRPDPAKPQPGGMMERLAAMMLRSDDCTHDHTESIRRLLRADAEFAMQIARLNFTLKRLTLRQEAMRERCREALVEAGCDPSTTTFPAQPAINRIGQRVAELRVSKGAAQQQRAENARALWKLWKESGMDIYSGRAAAPTKDPATTWTPSAPRGGARSVRQQQQQQQQQKQHHHHAPRPQPPATVGPRVISSGGSSGGGISPTLPPSAMQEPAPLSPPFTAPGTSHKLPAVAASLKAEHGDATS